jgi:MerR family copper efflux transcriptional regulator
VTDPSRLGRSRPVRLRPRSGPLTPYSGTDARLARVSTERGPSERLTIGIVAAQAGVGVETIRFYERKGLIDRPVRRVRGFRSYPLETVERVTFIRKAKDLGFSLHEVQDLLSIRDEDGATCADVLRRAEAKIADIDARIAALKTMRRSLGALMHACDGTGPVAKCPIVISLRGRPRIRGSHAKS